MQAGQNNRSRFRDLHPLKLMSVRASNVTKIRNPTHLSKLTGLHGSTSQRFLESVNVAGGDLKISLSGDVGGRDVRYGGLPGIEALQITNEGSARIEPKRGTLRCFHFDNRSAIHGKSAK